jgi:hypothetical protein
VLNPPLLHAVTKTNATVKKAKLKQIHPTKNESLGNSKPPYKTIRIAAAENRRLKDID